MLKRKRHFLKNFFFLVLLECPRNVHALNILNKYCERQLEKWNFISIAQHNYCPSFRARENMRAVIKNIFMFFYGYLSFAFPYSFCAREMTKYYNKMAE